MKNIRNHLLFLFLIVSFNLFGQHESIFGEVSTSWNVFRDHLAVPHVDSIYVDNDTTIATIDYKNIRTYIPGYGTITAQLREDTVAGKVWYRSPWDDTEYLIMDLSLDVGDPFPIDSYWETQWPINLPLKVDSSYVLNGKKRIVITDQNDSDDWQFYGAIKFIEGIGPTGGPFWLEQNLGSAPRYMALLCMHKDGIQTHQSTFFNSKCTVLLGLNDHSVNMNIYVAPNPFSNTITVKVKEQLPFSGKIILCNSMGNVLLEKNVQTIQTHTLNDLESLPPGIYFIQLIDSRKEHSAVRKLIKN